MALQADWGMSWNARQLWRSAEALGRSAARGAEVRACKPGQQPAAVPAARELLVIGMDGGRVRTR